jgi:CBS domain-containing protein
MYVADILNLKGSKVVTIRPDLKVQHLAQCLRLERVGALVVSESGTAVDGIISERDIVLALA